MSDTVQDLRRRLFIAEAVCDAAMEAKEAGELPGCMAGVLEAWATAESRRVGEAWTQLRSGPAPTIDEDEDDTHVLGGES